MRFGNILFSLGVVPLLLVAPPAKKERPGSLIHGLFCISVPHAAQVIKLHEETKAPIEDVVIALNTVSKESVCTFTSRKEIRALRPIATTNFVVNGKLYSAYLVPILGVKINDPDLKNVEFTYSAPLMRLLILEDLPVFSRMRQQR